MRGPQKKKDARGLLSAILTVLAPKTPHIGLGCPLLRRINPLAQALEPPPCPNRPPAGKAFYRLSALLPRQHVPDFKQAG